MSILHPTESGEKHALHVPGLPYAVELPYVRIPRQGGGGLRIASFNLVGQARLNRDLGRLLAARIREAFGADGLDGVVIVTAVEKALMLAQETAAELGMEAVAVAYNRVKPHMDAENRPVVAVGAESVTSGGKFLALYERDINLVAHARGVLLLDDVVSTGGTILALADLVEEAARAVGATPPPVLGVFCAADEGDALLTMPAPVYALAHLPTPVPVP